MDDIFAADFSFQSWVNRQLQSAEQPEQHVSSLLIKLTLLEQDIEAALEYKCAQVVQETETTVEEVTKIGSELKEITDFIRTLESELEFFRSPELSQIGDDHTLSERSTACKTALQEVEFYEKHSKEAQALLASPLPDLHAIGKLLNSMRHSLLFLKCTQKFEELKREYEVLESCFMGYLMSTCSAAISRDQSDGISEVYKLYQLVGKEDEFLSVFTAYWKDAADKEPGFHMELGLQDSLLRVTAFTDRVLQRLKSVVASHNNQVAVVKSLLPDKSLSRCFLELPISEHLSAYQSSLVPLFSFVKRTASDLTPLHSTVVNICTHLPEREGMYLRAVFKTLFASAIKPGVSAKVPSETWGLQVIEETRKSWQRCLSMSYGVSSSEWSDQISTVLDDLFTSILHELQRFSRATLNGELDLAFPQVTLSYAFDWGLVQRAIQQYEVMLTMYAGFLAADSQCRHEFLQSISTTYFSQKHELDKELQSALIAGLPEMYKNVQTKARALREGAHFLPTAVKKLETIMTEAKNAVLRMFYSPIYPLLASYHTKPCWNSAPFIDPDLPRFSLSQSEDILQIGEHFLMIPQGRASAGDKLQYSEAFALEYAVVPEKRAPLATLGQQFWVVVVGNSLLALVVQKVLMIKEISKAGAEQLAMDIEYLMKVTRSFTIDDGTGVHIDTLGVIQKHLRGEADPTNAISQSLALKMNKK